MDDIFMYQMKSLSIWRYRVTVSVKARKPAIKTAVAIKQRMAFLVVCVQHTFYEETRILCDI